METNHVPISFRYVVYHLKAVKHVLVSLLVVVSVEVVGIGRLCGERFC